MLTAFGDPLETFGFYTNKDDIHFEAQAVEKTEKFKILITGKEGELLRAETVNIDPALLQSNEPTPSQTRMTIGYSPVPSAFEKIKFAFDESKNYALASKEIYSPSGSIRENVEVKQFSLIDGVWLPISLERTFYQNGEVRMIEDVSYSDLQIPDEIDDGRFRIDFPAGTHVTDEVSGTAFGPDELLPFDISEVQVSSDGDKIDIKFDIKKTSNNTGESEVVRNDTNEGDERPLTESRMNDKSSRLYLTIVAVMLVLLIIGLGIWRIARKSH